MGGGHREPLIVRWKRFLLTQSISSSTEIKSTKTPALIAAKYGVVDYDD